MNKNVREIPLMFSRIMFAGINPFDLNKKTATVFGLGGLGAIVAEMLARLGFGRLILVDKDVVGLENLNRLGFSYSDVGKPKVEVISKKLEELSKARQDLPLKIEKYMVDVIAWEKLPEIVKKSDILFSCLDNLDARLEINYWAVKQKKPLIDGGTSLNGLRGRVLTVIPYSTPCLGCYFDRTTLTGEEVDGSTLNCGASLPTTMAIIAAIQVEMGLRILLKREIIPRILVNLEENEIIVVNDKNVKRRRDCPYCGVDSDARK